MVNRWIGIVCTLSMLSANLALFLHDILPDWAAGDPPPSEITAPGSEPERRAQVGIFDQNQQRIGYSWTISSISSDVRTVRSWTVLKPRVFSEEVSIPRVRISTYLTYHRDARVDNLSIELSGLEFPVRLRGELLASGEFPCRWEIGTHGGYFVLPADATRALGDVIRPFDRLPDLWVGRTWRQKLYNPLAQLFPRSQVHEVSMESVLVRVTGVENLLHGGELLRVHRVESERARAWVAPDGRVLRQEVDLPLFGRLTLLDEPYSDEEYTLQVGLRARSQ